MIPRAKYIHPTILHQQMTFKKIDKPKRPNLIYKKSVRDSPIEATVGALVSAGFEVSTIVNNHATPITPVEHFNQQHQLQHSSFDTFLHTDEYVLENIICVSRVFQ